MDRRFGRILSILVGGAIALTLLLHAVFNIFFEEWLKHQLERYVGLTVAEMIERFGAAAIPILLSMAVIWWLHRAVKREYVRDPLVILYDTSNVEFVRPISGLYGTTGEFYSIGLMNTGGVTLNDAMIRVLDSWFTREIIDQAQPRSAPRDHRSIVVLRRDALHPGAPEIEQLVGLTYHTGASAPEYLLNQKQRFVVEATARDVAAVRREFEYDPQARPMLRMLPD